MRHPQNEPPTRHSSGLRTERIPYLTRSLSTGNPGWCTRPTTCVESERFLPPSCLCHCRSDSFSRPIRLGLVARTHVCLRPVSRGTDQRSSPHNERNHGSITALTPVRRRESARSTVVHACSAAAALDRPCVVPLEQHVSILPTQTGCERHHSEIGSPLSTVPACSILDCLGTTEPDSLRESSQTPRYGRRQGALDRHSGSARCSARIQFFNRTFAGGMFHVKHHPLTVVASFLHLTVGRGPGGESPSKKLRCIRVSWSISHAVGPIQCSVE